MFRVSDRTTAGIILRGNSGAPLAGHSGERPHAVRLPRYARVDARAEHTFGASQRRITAFAEALNLLNRRNLAPVDGTAQPLGPRRLSMGLDVRFGE
jgi:hypothetical protein